jgi:hypothetical protein
MAEAMMGGSAPQPTMEDFAAFEQIRQEVSPSEINETLLATAAEADPMAVAEFKSELRDLDLPPEVLDALDGMVDEILAAPERYAEIRAQYLAQDMSEDLLPEVFDAEFFGALNMALDEIRATSGGPARAPQGFARGGIASLGRNGDTMLAHVTPAEMRMLKANGGAGTINPRTGLPEFFSLKKVFSKIGRAAKKFARSTIGKIVIGTALFMFVGPMAYGALGLTAGTAGAAAVSGFVAGAGSSLLAGESLKDSLKAGAIGGITAGAVRGVSNTFGGAPAPVSESIPVDTSTLAGTPAELGASVTGLETPSLTDQLTLGTPVSPGIPAATTAGDITRQSLMPSAVDTSALTGPPLSTNPVADIIAQQNPTFTTPQSFSATPQVDTGGIAGLSGGAPPPPTFGQNVKDIFLNDTLPDSSRFDSFKSAFSPTARKAAGEVNAQLAGREASQQVYADALLDGIAQPRLDPYVRAAASKASESAILKNTPNMVANWAPAAVGAMGVAGLAGAFDAPESEMPDGYEDFMNRRGNPERYALSFGGVRPMGSSGYQTYTPPPYVPPTYNAAQGSGPSGVAQGFPRMNGPIDGPGTGTSDDVPAMLSDGEFVFTAKAVRNMGQGSRRKGAKKMYALMKKLEGTA